MVLEMKRQINSCWHYIVVLQLLKNQIHYRIDLEHLTDRDKEILHEIYFYLHTKENHAKLNAIYQETERGIQEAYDNSGLIQNFFGWIFSSRKKKQKFLQL